MLVVCMVLFLRQQTNTAHIYSVHPVLVPVLAVRSVLAQPDLAAGNRSRPRLFSSLGLEVSVCVSPVACFHEIGLSGGRRRKLESRQAGVAHTVNISSHRILTPTLLRTYIYDQ